MMEDMGLDSIKYGSITWQGVRINVQTNLRKRFLHGEKSINKHLLFELNVPNPLRCTSMVSNTIMVAWTDDVNGW